MDLPVGISTLQRTDRWIGAPLCAVLTLLRKVFESAGPPGPRQVRRILFVKFAEQGSTVLAYPAICRAPALFSARSPNTTALWAGIACSPCVNAYNNRQSVCRNNLCMQAITVDDVFEKVTRIYDSFKSSTRRE